MDREILRRYLPAILLVVGILLVWSSRSQTAVPLAGSLETVLPAYDNLRVAKQTVTAEERKIAGMSDYIARSYWRDTNLVFTAYVGYYDRQTQGKSMHSPRNCLPGAGWEILTSDTTLIAGAGRNHVVNKYTLKNGPLQALVLYWYQGRGRVVASELSVKWNLLRDAAFEGHTEEALVRVMAPIHPTKEGDASAALAATRDAEAIARSVAERLLGDVARVLPRAELAQHEASATSVAALPAPRAAP